MIDLHTHLHPPRLFRAIKRWFAEHSDWDMADQPTDPHEVATVLREAGVTRFVFCSYAHKPGMARDINAWLAGTSRDLGGYGLPLATVHPDDPGYLDDLKTAFDDGCIGLKLHEDVQQLACDDPRFKPVFDFLAERGAFALIHAGPIPWQIEPGSGVRRIARVLRSHPGLRLVVAHYGLPDTASYFELMDEHPGLHLDTTMVFAEGSPMRPAAIDTVAFEAHAQRVLYGTDFPVTPHPYDTERAALASVGLSSAAQSAVFHDNAVRLLAAGPRGSEFARESRNA